jgi:hypothetical protein
MLILTMHRSLNCPLSYFGYQLERAEHHGAGSHDEAIAAFEDMLTKVDNAPRTAALCLVSLLRADSRLLIGCSAFIQAWSTVKERGEQARIDGSKIPDS